MACDLASRGFAVNMFEMPQFQSGVRELFNTRTIDVSGVMQGRFELNKVTSEGGSCRPTSPQHYGHRNSAKRPFFLYEYGVTPSSCRLNLQVDRERKEIGRRLRYRLTPIEDFSSLKDGYTWQELYVSLHGSI